jgi:hypothetical protein
MTSDNAQVSGTVSLERYPMGNPIITKFVKIFVWYSRSSIASPNFFHLELATIKLESSVFVAIEVQT